MRQQSVRKVRGDRKATINVSMTRVQPNKKNKKREKLMRKQNLFYKQQVKIKLKMILLSIDL